jgi:hypothetical protein
MRFRFLESGTLYRGSVDYSENGGNRSEFRGCPSRARKQVGKLCVASLKTTYDDLKYINTAIKLYIHINSILRIQKYLQPSKIQINKEEAQLIFKLQCRFTEAKGNLKGKYDNLECRACGKEEENQMHILKCKELNENKNMDELNYEHLLNETASD